MFEFKKLCNEFERLSAVERGLILTENSVKILAKLRLSGENGKDSAQILACFLIASIVSDGKVNEQEYILMYPALCKVFGTDFDFTQVKEMVEKNVKDTKAVVDYSKEMLELLASSEESLREDLIILCLCIVSIDGKVSFKERRYIKKLIK